MLNHRSSTFKRVASIPILALLVHMQAGAGGATVNLLQGGEKNWLPADGNWTISGEKITGSTGIMDGAKTDPAASAFLVSRQAFGGDVTVTMNITFEAGRYLGIYLDFDQETQTGIWMGTGHSLPAEAPDNEVERAYIKTVEESFWIVRATGELVVKRGVPLRLRFVRADDVYSIYNDETLVVTYHKAGGYAPGPLQIRLTNASARIDLLEVSSEWAEPVPQ